MLRRGSSDGRADRGGLSEQRERDRAKAQKAAAGQVRLLYRVSLGTSCRS